MKKRTSRDKIQKKSVGKKIERKEGKKKYHISPLLTLDCLLQKTKCLQEARQFEKVRIQRIVQGSTWQSLNFYETQKRVCLQEHLRKYYQFSDVRTIFTDLITRNSLTDDITFVDFKLRHFRIMNNYHYLKKQLPKGKGKEEFNNTASHSFVADNEQKIELGVKNIIKNNKIETASQNISTSFITMLTKNIQKMIKNIKDEGSINKDIDFKPVLTQENMNTPDISHIHHERIHTTPEPMTLDFYGLGEYWNGTQLKPKQNHKMNKQPTMMRQPTIQTHRFQTEYDTEYITAEKKSKSKCVLGTSRSKKSFSKKKILSKGKSPPSGLKCSLKVKK